jgi:hypothetical protein
MECLHGNGNPSDNRLKNLRWGTRLENKADSARHGTIPRGERSGMAKLTNVDIPLIFSLRSDGWSYPRIGRRFGVAGTTIHRVVKGLTWLHATSSQAG